MTDDNKNKRWRDSFGHAYEGLSAAVRQERNMKVHVIMTVLVAVCAVIFELTVTEKAVVFICCGLVLTAELFNTAIEAVVDICSPQYSEGAKKAKDTAAAAVLVMSIISAAVGIIIFFPYAHKIGDFLRQMGF